jgi:hypothetical protein
MPCKTREKTEYEFSQILNRVAQDRPFHSCEFFRRNSLAELYLIYSE